MCECCQGAAEYQYCQRCRDEWTKSFLTQTLIIEPYRGSCKCDYNGGVVHVLQIGLGTFGTFLHRDTYWINMLLEASSRLHDEALKGIGVDPVRESVGAFETLARSESHISAVLGAVGEQSGSVSLHCLPYMARQNVRDEMARKNLNLIRQAECDMMLAYVDQASAERACARLNGKLVCEGGDDEQPIIVMMMQILLL